MPNLHLNLKTYKSICDPKNSITQLFLVTIFRNGHTFFCHKLCKLAATLKNYQFPQFLDKKLMETALFSNKNGNFDHDKQPNKETEITAYHKFTPTSKLTIFLI